MTAAFPPRVGALVLLALGLLPSPARAYRPFDFTDADVVGEHRFEIELGPWEYVSLGAERLARGPNVVVNYGLGWGFEVVLEGVNAVPLKSEPGADAHWEDLAASVKKVLRRGSLQDAPGLSVATEESVTLPRWGSPHAGFSANGIVSSASRRGVAHLNLELERTAEQENGVASGLIFELGEANVVSPVVELSLEAGRGAPPTQAVLLGVIYVPRETFELDLALRAGRSEGERLTEVRAGMTWQFARRSLVKGVGHVLPRPLRRRRH